MIYLLRHGEIEGAGIKRFIGQTDVPLSDNGISQARQWNRAFKTIAVDAVYSSPLVRAASTARIASGLQEASITHVPDLREINLGQWDGKSFQEIRTRFPEAWAQRGAAIASYRPPDGESFEDLSLRVLPAFRHIVESAGGKTVLVVAHAGVNRTILSSLLGSPLDDLLSIPQGYAALNCIELSGAGCSVSHVNLLPGSYAGKCFPAGSV